MTSPHLRRALLGLLLGTALATAGHAQPGPDAAAEYRIKAAFVCKFASYVEWPPQSFAQPDSPLVIGVMAGDAVAQELVRTAAGLSIDQRPLQVRRLRPGEPVAGAHLVYIARSEDAHLAETLAALRGQAVLVVTESAGPALGAGSMINFVVVQDKVRFDIAPQVAEASRLRISARLLGVARSLVGRS